MEKNRKILKECSIVILAIVALNLVMGIVNLCVNGLPNADQIPEGMSAELVKIVAIIALVVGFILLFPQIYLGLKGLKIAGGEAVTSKAPLNWAIVLAVLAAISAISSISNLVKAFNADTLISVLTQVVDVVFFAYYYICVRKIAEN